MVSDLQLRPGFKFESPGLRLAVSVRLSPARGWAARPGAAPRRRPVGFKFLAKNFDQLELVFGPHGPG